jgi:DNA polymerase-3 subunit beta
MEFRIDRAALTEAVAWAARSLPTRPPVPVLGGLLLDAADGRLRISGFDYEASARIDVPATVTAPGRVLVLGRRLLDICKVLPADTEVLCALDGTRFTLDGGGTRFGLSTLPAEEYPALPQVPPVRGTVDAAEFADAVGQVVIAAGRDDTLPVLTGVQLRLDGESMTLAASDRFRYAVRTLAWKPEPGAGAEHQVVVPGRRLQEITRALTRSGLVRLSLDGGLIGFQGSGMHSTLRLLEGRLPRYDKLFTLDNPAVAETDREALADAVRRVAVVAEPNSPVRLTFSADSVLLQAGYEDDIASQRLPATMSGPDTMTVAFNPAYLLDALNSFHADRVRFDLAGPGQRALLSGEQDHRHLLMSVRQLS